MATAWNERTLAQMLHQPALFFQQSRLAQRQRRLFRIELQEGQVILGENGRASNGFWRGARSGGASGRRVRRGKDDLGSGFA